MDLPFTAADEVTLHADHHRAHRFGALKLRPDRRHLLRSLRDIIADRMNARRENGDVKSAPLGDAIADPISG